MAREEKRKSRTKDQERPGMYLTDLRSRRSLSLSRSYADKLASKRQQDSIKREVCGIDAHSNTKPNVMHCPEDPEED